MMLANYAEPYRKRICTCGCGAQDKTLTGWCLHYKVPLVGAHGAGGDALAAARLWRRIMATHPRKFAGMTLPALHQSQVGWKKVQADSLRDWWKQQGDERWREVDGTWPLRRDPVAVSS
jgi:DNA polymerase-3 subunit epsilon